MGVYETALVIFRDFNVDGDPESGPYQPKKSEIRGWAAEIASFASGGGLLLSFDTGTADADPGAGNIRFNHATPGSVTFAYVSETDRNGADITDWLASLDDGGNADNRGRLILQVDGDASVRREFIIAGDVVPASGYFRLPLSPVSSAPGSLADEEHVALYFAPAGADGAVQEVVGGDNISVDPTDPSNPIIYATGLLKLDGTNAMTAAFLVEDLASPPSAPSSGFTKLYVRDGKWRGLNAAGVEVIFGSGRIPLTANTDFFVRTDGDDGNDGSTNDAGGAFETLQGACNYIKDYIDLSGFTATIRPQKIGGVPTTYDGVALFAPFTGGGEVYIIGDTVTPADIIVHSAAANCFQLYYGAKLTIKGVKFTALTGRALYTAFGGIIRFGYVDFGDCGTYHLRASGSGAQIYSSEPYTISGDAVYHTGIHAGAGLYLNGCVITATGTPNFSTAFLGVNGGGFVELNGADFSGATGITGRKYLITGGEILGPSSASLDDSLPGSLPGVRSVGRRVVTIPDDNVYVVEQSIFHAGIMLARINAGSGARTAVPSGEFRVRAGAGGVHIENVNLDLTKVTLTTATILVGTTGTDTFFTISTHANGNIYLENRTGASRSIAIEFFG